MSNVAKQILEVQDTPNIIIKDTYCVKTNEEIQGILDEIGKIYSKYFSEHPEDYD